MKYHYNPYYKIGDLVQFKNWETDGNLRRNVLVVHNGIIVKRSYEHKYDWTVRSFITNEDYELTESWITKLNEE